MRLTYRDSTVPHTNAKGELWEAYSDANYNEVINKLAAYEDTGIEPEEIEDRQDVCLWIPEDRFAELIKAEADRRLVVFPCKVGDTVWFYLYEDRGGIRKGIYQGVITELKAVQRLNRDAPLFLAFVRFEYPDPWYSYKKMSTSEMHCSFGDYGSWVQFYLTRAEAEAAPKPR